MFWKYTDKKEIINSILEWIHSLWRRLDNYEKISIYLVSFFPELESLKYLVVGILEWYREHNEEAWIENQRKMLRCCIWSLWKFVKLLTTHIKYFEHVIDVNGIHIDQMHLLNFILCLQFLICFFIRPITSAVWYMSNQLFQLPFLHDS